jgi:hypothetical protein
VCQISLLKTSGFRSELLIFIDDIVPLNAINHSINRISIPSSIQRQYACSTRFKKVHSRRSSNSSSETRCGINSVASTYAKARQATHAIKDDPREKRWTKAWTCRRSLPAAFLLAES